MIVKYFLAKHGESVLGGWWAVKGLNHLWFFPPMD